jgi:chemotaxis protein histidine kinase CheA
MPEVDHRRLKLVAHTLKGETRTLRLTGLTERIHNFEDAIIMGLNVERPLKELIKTFNIYENQRLEIFGRTEAQGKIFVDEEDLRAAINGERTDRIQHYINKSAINFFADLPSIRMLGISAKSLDKLALITINDQQGPHFVDIKDSTFLESIMVHLVSNAIDHGLEGPDERIRLGKKASGLITIDVLDNAFVFRDDGRGLDLELIREKIIDLHRPDVKTFSSFSDETDAEAIFLPGLSTKNEASVLSGRGIGMDAIRTILAKRGGSISVRLGERRGRFASFELLVSIPGMIRTDLRARSNLNATWTIEPATPTRA